MGELVWEIQLPAFCPTFWVLNERWHSTGPLALVLGLFLIILGFLSHGHESFRIVSFCSVAKVKGGRFGWQFIGWGGCCWKYIGVAKKEGEKGNKDCFSLFKMYGYTGFEIHHQVEKKWETKGNYPVYLNRPSLDSVSYNHLCAGCLSKYN